MKKIISIALAVLTIPVFTGCVTSRVPGPHGTTVTVVNTNNLMLDAAVFQGVVAISVSLLTQRDAGTIQPLRNAHFALDGIINGSNPMTTQEVLSMLKAQNNPALTAEVTSLIQTASALEQNLLAKYGAEVSGQIILALVKAADAGIVVGLASK